MGTHLKWLAKAVSNECPQLLFLWRNDKNIFHLASNATIIEAVTQMVNN